MQCQAHNRKGERCKKSAVDGKKVCRLHGGLTPGGPASVHYKHGRYSAYLPAGLMEKYSEAQRDPDLLNLRDEISLMDVRLKQLIEKLPAGGASHSWLELSDEWRKFIEAQREANAARTDEQRASAQNKVANSLRALNEIINDGAQEAGVWNDIIISVDNRRKLTASEAKRLTDMQQMITSERAIALVYAILDVIRRNVTDKDQLSAISTDVRRLVTIPNKMETEDAN